MNSPKKIFFIALLPVVTILFSGFFNQSSGADIRRKVAEAYGIQFFDQIEQIRYTFNVQKGDKRVSRLWIWQPKTDQVTFKSGPNAEPIVYQRKEITSATQDKLKKIDGWFINDNYWLLFPIRSAWDTQAKMEDIGPNELPIGNGSARCVVVTYPSEGGYTPGDAYDLFLDERYRITQWIYRRGGANEPTRVATWDDHRRVGPLVLSLNHLGNDKNFRVWFTDVAVKTADKGTWSYPQ